MLSVDPFNEEAAMQRVNIVVFIQGEFVIFFVQRVFRMFIVIVELCMEEELRGVMRSQFLEWSG